VKCPTSIRVSLTNKGTGAGRAETLGWVARGQVMCGGKVIGDRVVCEGGIVREGGNAMGN
jgi:hypothetical protein